MSAKDSTHPLKDYLKKIEQALLTGRATEHTYRSILESLVESLSGNVTVINEPKRIKCGAPDLIVMRRETPLGYIEAKDIGESLDKAEASDQLARYRDSLGNLILTDYLEFRWYVQGKHRLTARLAKSRANGKLQVEKDGEHEVAELLNAYLNAQAPTVSSPKELAERMASIARLIRDTIRRALDAEDLSDNIPDPLHDLLKGFQRVLLHDLTEEQFADMYAQTICYGLFAARCTARGGARFTREQAAYQLPKTNPFLRKMFMHIAGPDLDERIAWAVDDLAALLDHTDIAAILQDFGKRTRREDPVVHFYETFLAAYDPKLRETRGVYYTPEPVVSYIVRSVDHILKTEFKLAGGLADASKIKVKRAGENRATEVHRVLILDPATGTGTFLYGVINHIFESFRNNQGMWSAYVSEHLLPRLFGFELLMAPYTVAHLKLDLLLDETGYNFETNERLRVYLTNTLEEAHAAINLPLFAQEIAAEANEASRIKQEAPVMVVLGNPPYSGDSVNSGKWIVDLLHGTDRLNAQKTANYYEVDGQQLGEKNPKWLLDDYVKFIRFAQWRIEQTGYGILAFITNHGYLDNPTFRGMRQSLMETFDDIYVLNLHGNSKKKERAPDGSEDKNVFDIQQGVAIGIFIKRASGKKKTATVQHAHLWGLREIYEENEHVGRVLTGGKYHWLWQNDLSTTCWTILEPKSPHYLFVPQDNDLRVEYDKAQPVVQIMPVNGWGVKTRRDYLLVDFSRTVLASRFQDIRKLSTEEAISKYGIKEAPHWNFASAKKQMREDTDNNVREILFRPFDIRFVYYEKCMIERGDHRFDLMRHLFAENLSLITVRRSEIAGIPQHFFCSKIISVLHSTSAKEANFVFPLYLYPDNLKANLFDTDESTKAPSGRRANLAPEFVADFAGRLKMAFIPDGKGDLDSTFGPEDVFAYMYAVFHAPTYRSRYAEFLKIDFPRLPLTSKPELFRALCALGDELVGLHLMERHAPAITRYPVAGDNMVEAVRYTQPDEGSTTGRVWINREQYFEGVPPEVWGFHVGGYQVCQKWLKDRKGRKLTYDDLTHYQHIVSALAETIRLMAEIDTVIEEYGSWPLD
ncbi:MAG TPA: type ISP restriction/modification enzyme [Pyrinomonadaceae bacterium]|jgi:predicted helicase